MYSKEIEKKLLKRRPRFLHSQKLKRIFNEMEKIRKNNIDQISCIDDEEKQTEKQKKISKLISQSSSLLYFPIEDEFKPWCLLDYLPLWMTWN